MLWTKLPLKLQKIKLITILRELEFIAKPIEVNHVCNCHIILKHDSLEVKCKNCLAIIFSLIYVISCKCSKALEKEVMAQFV